AGSKGIMEFTGNKIILQPALARGFMMVSVQTTAADIQRLADLIQVHIGELLVQDRDQIIELGFS
ncbi:hypothetical protein, partial [Verrucomicrobium sp. BvORR106]|uniref:hypothetical protein n=1 Tax=Verrucomicrobium sp. BvORR106 TaxID=1403819 RepID=UPI000570E530